MVYFITDNNGFTKIGSTDYEVEKRLKELQCGNPRQLEVVKTIECYNQRLSSLDVERCLHQYFDYCRVRGEWFKTEGLQNFYKLSESEVAALIVDLMKKPVVTHCRVTDGYELEQWYRSQNERLLNQIQRLKSEVENKRKLDKKQKEQIKDLKQRLNESIAKARSTKITNFEGRRDKCQYQP